MLGQAVHDAKFGPAEPRKRLAALSDRPTSADQKKSATDLTTPNRAREGAGRLSPNGLAWTCGPAGKSVRLGIAVRVGRAGGAPAGLRQAQPERFGIRGSAGNPFALSLPKGRWRRGRAGGAPPGLRQAQPERFGLDLRSGWKIRSAGNRGSGGTGRRCASRASTGSARTVRDSPAGNPFALSRGWRRGRAGGAPPGLRQAQPERFGLDLRSGWKIRSAGNRGSDGMGRRCASRASTGSARTVRDSRFGWKSVRLEPVEGPVAMRTGRRCATRASTGSARTVWLGIAVRLENPFGWESRWDGQAVRQQGFDRLSPNGSGFAVRLEIRSGFAVRLEIRSPRACRILSPRRHPPGRTPPPATATGCGGPTSPRPTSTRDSSPASGAPPSRCCCWPRRASSWSSPGPRRTC